MLGWILRRDGFMGWRHKSSTVAIIVNDLDGGRRSPRELRCYRGKVKRVAEFFSDPFDLVTEYQQYRTHPRPLYNFMASVFGIPPKSSRIAVAVPGNSTAILETDKRVAEF